MSKYIYRTKEGEFETNYYDKISTVLLHAPNEFTPSLEVIEDGSVKMRFWHQNDKRHRLTGPAVIYSTGKEFWLNGKFYEFNSWILNHPNLNYYLETNGFINDTQKAIWKLKNL